MIIKKPYAFLIKRFKLIHAIMCVLLVYLILKSFTFLEFFNNYVNNRISDSIEVVLSEFNIFMFVSCILIILINIGIYYLLNIKKKPKKLYIINCILYIFLFIFFIVIFSLLKDLEYNSFSFDKARVIRDFCILFFVPQIVISFITLGRALGFNIKNFDFQKDINELEVDEKDYEEIEITLGNDNYKLKREVRKSLRLFKYFLLENKFFVTIICSTIALVVSLVVFLNLRVYNMHYNENQAVLANRVWYKALESYLAYKDIYDMEIAKDRYFVLIKVNINNKMNSDVAIERDTFRLNVNGNLYFPKFSYQEQFLDIGEVFTPCTLTSGESKDVLLVFEVGENQIKSEYILKITNASVSIGELNSKYTDVIIKPNNVNNNKDSVTYVIPNKFTFSDTILNKTELYVSSYELADSFREQYSNCIDDKCSNYTYVVKPSGKGGTILKLKSNVTIDDSLYISKYIKYPSNFYKYFATIYYRYQGETKVLRPNIINSAYGKENYTYIEVPSKLKEANKIEMLINVRGTKYTLVLK